MKNVKKKIQAVTLKNRYSGEIVECPNINEISVRDGVSFVQVKDNRDPNRFYWVNREAFEIVTK